MKKLPRVQHGEIKKWYIQNKIYIAKRIEQDPWYNLIGVPEEEETASGRKAIVKKRIAEDLPEQKKKKIKYMNILRLNKVTESSGF